MLESIVLILFLGILFSKAFQKVRLPGLLGMILVGVLIGPYGLNLLDKESILKSSSNIRMLALIIILLRAGLGLDKDILKKVGKPAIKMSAIPCLCEGFTIMFTANKLVGLPILEAGMLGFIIAAVSPAVVVPSMLYLREKKLGIRKGVPVIILAGASIDDVFAITIFTAFLSMSKGGGKSIVFQISQIPIQIIGGIVLGILAGYIIYKAFNLEKLKLSNPEQLAILFSAALAIVILGEKVHVAGLLAVMTMGFILLEKDKDTAERLEEKLNKIWFFAQIFLFVLIGAEVNTQVALKAGLVGIVIIIVGLIGRSIGVIIALRGSNLNIKERLFCAIAYMPKATVQAAIGGIPLASGIFSGAYILAVAVLAIIITAPLGVVGIKVSAPKLLEQN
ncbi:sodium:proton antiporter [Clostridium bovifaecis]|uniref:Sodium:proton antiporter n=1 Tax=Clostridium bovifaecis TaxID=2184719 RepID=A0A6I6EXE7_9CLOT|nr:sodium:proton antiporter [Clostridium bovifaecis]